MANIKTMPVPSILKNRRNYMSITKLKNKPKKLGNRRQAGQQAAGRRQQAASRAGGPAGGKLQAAGYRRQAAGSKQSRISDQEAASGRVGPQAASSWTEEPE